MRKCPYSEVPRLLNVHQGIFIGRYLRRYFSILARPAMSDSPQREPAEPILSPSMFLAALTLLLSSLPQSGHLKRTLTFLLLFTTNHPRLCRTLLAEQYYALTGFSGRTTDTSAVAFSILARPAMTDSPAERDGCADALANMFFAALTLLLRSLPQSGHLNRILLLSCLDASN